MRRFLLKLLITSILWIGMGVLAVVGTLLAAGAVLFVVALFRAL